MKIIGIARPISILLIYIVFILIFAYLLIKGTPYIIEELKDTGWSTTTIQTYLARLVKKGALETERQGKGYLYRPTISEKECQIAESKSFLNRVFHGSFASMVSGFVKSGNLTEEELKALKTMIEEQMKNNGDDR